MFSSKWGLVLSCLGCVIGTGNIWRFPRIVANNSGDKGRKISKAVVSICCLFTFYKIPLNPLVHGIPIALSLIVTTLQMFLIKNSFAQRNYTNSIVN